MHSTLQRSVSHAIPWILPVTGSFTAGHAVQIKEQALLLIDNGHIHIIIDMTTVSEVDIAGINVLVQIYTSIMEKDGSMEIRLLRHGNLSQMLHLTKFDRRFHLVFME